MYFAARIGLQQWSFFRRQQMPTKITNSLGLRGNKNQQRSTNINTNQQNGAESSIVIKNHHKSSPPSGAIIKNHQ